MIDVVEITINEFKENIYDKYIKLFPEDEQRNWGKIEKTYKDGIEKTTSKVGLTAEVLDAMNEIYADKETRAGKYLSPVYASSEDLRFFGTLVL